MLSDVSTGASKMLFERIDVAPKDRVLPDTREVKVLHKCFEARNADLILCWTEPAERRSEVDERISEVFMRLDIAFPILMTNTDAFRSFPCKDRFIVSMSRPHLQDIDLVRGESTSELDMDARERKACGFDVGIKPSKIIGKRPACPLADCSQSLFSCHVVSTGGCKKSVIIPQQLREDKAGARHQNIREWPSPHLTSPPSHAVCERICTRLVGTGTLDACNSNGDLIKV